MQRTLPMAASSIAAALVMFGQCVHGLAFGTANAYRVNPEFQGWVGCVSHHEAEKLLLYREEVLAGRLHEIQSSINLHFTEEILLVDKEGVRRSGSELVATWGELEAIASKKNGCYALYDDGSKPWHISTLSKSSGMPASLLPPLSDPGAPTIVLGGFTMHRIAGDKVNPTVDTAAKLSSAPIFKDASVLDTCMGLGYTAIGAAKLVTRNIINNDPQKIGKESIDGADDNLESETEAGKRSNESRKKGLKAGSVVTIEYDEASLEIAAHNPWSQGLFDGSLPIDILQGDSCELVKDMPSSHFDVIIHDPPARALCRTDVYGVRFYKELYRVLRKNGSIFHYIGNPRSKEGGRLYRGVQQRMQEAGFEGITKVERAFGLVAKKKKPSLLRPSNRSLAIKGDIDFDGDCDDQDDYIL